MELVITRSKEQWSVGFPTEFKVVGHNPENADLDRPNGEIIRERYFIVAENARGERRTWGGYYETEAEAELDFSLFASPVPFWDELDPAYGSVAYADNWRFYEAGKIAWERGLDSRWGAFAHSCFSVQRQLSCRGHGMARTYDPH